MNVIPKDADFIATINPVERAHKNSQEIRILCSMRHYSYMMFGSTTNRVGTGLNLRRRRE